jgi:oligopeptide transport system substrate-binding protein
MPDQFAKDIITFDKPGTDGMEEDDNQETTGAMMVRAARQLALALAAFTLAGCGLFGEDDPVQIAAIGPLIAAPNPMNGPLSPPNAALLTATAQGLVSIDADGQTDVGLAERWTVTTDGRSYIFRIREAEWGDGKRVTAQDVARLLTQYISPRNRHPLRANFVDVESIRAMTDQVIEIRLKRPQSHLLELLAHPSMALPLRGRGWGPMDARRGNGSIMLVPQPDPLAEDPDAARAAVEDPAGWVELRGVRAPVAIARFKDEVVDGVFGGRMQDFPYYVGSRIARNRLVVDPVPGLFGLAVVSERGVLATEAGRDALSMAIDRARAVGAFGLDEWAVQESLRPSQNLRGPSEAPLYPAWIERSMDERRAQAAARVAAYRGAAPLRIALPPGPGSRILFAWIAADLRAIGLDAQRVDITSAADLVLIDEVAPADDPIWAFRRLSCGTRILCSRDAQAAVRAAEVTTDPIDRARRIAEAEVAMVRHAAWIPLATPLRWSVISARLTGVRANNRGEHPLNRLRAPPT